MRMSARQLFPDPKTRKQNVWTIGTLTYTFSGIVSLFSLLLLGDFANSIKGRSVFQLVQLMFKTYGASDFLNTLMIVSLPSIIGLVLGPVISVHSDRCRSRWGRRIPYLALTTPAAALAIAGFAYSPLIGRTISGWCGMAENTAVLWTLGIFWGIFEFATVISGSIFGALVNDVVPHQLLGRFYGLFRIVSLLCGILFNFWFLGFAATHAHVLFLSVAVVYGVGFMYMCLKIREGDYPPPEKKERKGMIAAITEYCRECYSKPYYLLIYFFEAAMTLAIAPVNSFSMFYAQDLSVDMDVYGKFLAVTYMISFALSYFWGVLADRIHPLRASILFMGLYAVMGIVSFFLIRNTATYGVAFILHGVLAGGYLTVSASLSQRLLPRAQFAQFNSAGGLVCSVLMVFLVPLIGKFLDWTGHQYQYTYLLGGLMALLSVFLGSVLYRLFRIRQAGKDGEEE